MLTRIDVDSENAFMVPILGVTPKDSLLIRSITGLNPPEITLFMGEYARDGGSYQGRRVGQRNVVMNFDLNPNPALGETVSGLRQMLYKAFADPYAEADHIKINLHDSSGIVRYLVGYTEKIEAELFDIDTMVQVSILCPDPYIRDVEETRLFNPSGWTSVPFEYAGTAEAGFEAEIHMTQTSPKLTIENNGKKMELTKSFLVGDVIKVNTNAGSRNLTLTRSGTTTSLIPVLSPTSPWLALHSQANTMSVYGSTDANLVAGVQELSFIQTYWGI